MTPGSTASPASEQIAIGKTIYVTEAGSSYVTEAGSVGESGAKKLRNRITPTSESLNPLDWSVPEDR